MGYYTKVKKDFSFRKIKFKGIDCYEGDGTRIGVTVTGTAQMIRQILKSEYPDIPGYVINEEIVKVPAGWLIEQCGWKGKRFGTIGVHTRQALVLVNYSGGKGLEIKQLSEKIQASVEERFGIYLHTEVNFI